MDLKIKKIKKEFEIIGFYTAFRFEWNEAFVFNGERHHVWEIVYLDSGKVEVTEDEKVYTLESGNIILHAPMEFHRIRSTSGTSPSGYIISFEASGELPEQLKNGIFVLDPNSASNYEAIVKQIQAFLKVPTGEFAGQEAAARLTAFLIEIANKTGSTERLSNTQSAMAYRTIISLMTKRVCENCSLSEIAAECNISTSYLKLLFKTYAGIAPKQYYAHLRTQYAAELLKNGLSSAEIANRMNFSSPSYFSSFFKKQTHLLPSEYQKNAPV
ncbi:MAG: helix-turn-helix domain-containing protein [Ruminococcaceae bacterium]|nr:helix-turn-helix domain-containing protein [Oscillospiraceae bacterium]